MLSLFDDGSEPEAASPAPVMMSAPQRAEIRELFGALGITTAREQFDQVRVLAHTRITSVSELDSLTAHRLIGALRSRVANRNRMSTGNSWDNREADTWIDKL